MHGRAVIVAFWENYARAVGTEFGSLADNAVNDGPLFAPFGVPQSCTLAAMRGEPAAVLAENNFIVIDRRRRADLFPGIHVPHLDLAFAKRDQTPAIGAETCFFVSAKVDDFLEVVEVHDRGLPAIQLSHVAISGAQTRNTRTLLCYSIWSFPAEA